MTSLYLTSDCKSAVCLIQDLKASFTDNEGGKHQRGASLNLLSLDIWLLYGLLSFFSLFFFPLHVSSPLRTQWWITLCRWFPTLQTSMTLWCWWHEENWKGRMGTSPQALRPHPPPRLRSASWSATSSPPKMWVSRMADLEENTMCFVAFALLSFKSGIRVAECDEFGLILLPQRAWESSWI